MYSVNLLFNNINNSQIPVRSTGFKGSSAVIDGFQQKPDSDIFTTNPLNKNYTDKTNIENIAKSNPVLIEILKKNHIPLKVNIEELNKLKQGHLKNARLLSAKIYSALPEELKRNVNLSDIQQASMLHDYGKVLMPEQILNKKGALTTEENAIMQLHSEIGYELLKAQGVNKNVLKLVKYHHQNPFSSGYPRINDDFEYGIESQIISAADKYCALTEERSYKPALEHEVAMDIILDDVKTGLVAPEVYYALQKATK